MSLALIAILVAAMARSMPVPVADERAAPRPMIDGRTGEVAVSLKGVWREIGSGRLLRIGSDGDDLYHETRILCYRDGDDFNVPLTSRYSLYDLWSDGSALTLYYHDLGSSTRVFQNHQRYLRVASLPALCVPSLRDLASSDPRPPSICSGNIHPNHLRVTHCTRRGLGPGADAVQAARAA